MLRIITMTTLCLGLMTGCATTKNLVSFAKNKSETPMQQVLKAQPELATHENNIAVQQVFNRVEGPTVSRVTVLQTGLLDDSVSAIRTEYLFKLKNDQWALQNKQQSYQCYRNKDKNRFQTQPCA